MSEFRHRDVLQISREQFEHGLSHALPVLTFHSSLEHLRTMGVRFLEEMDDLDELHIARYQVRGALASIQAYYLAPTGEYTLYVDVPGAKLDVLGLGNVARTMLESLGVTPDQIQWVNKPLFAE